MSDLKGSTRLRAAPQPVPKVGKSERTRAAILDAALAFLWSRPFREMTVSSLMARTGVSRSAFYQYFNDLHELMETLLDMLQDDLVGVCYRRGPFLRAISDAATTDKRLEKAWKQFLAQFDDAVCTRIEADQKQGLIPDFEARPVAFALNRLDVYTLIHEFGQRPRSRPEPVREALARIWISTLYGAERVERRSSDLVRK
jgi:AcrR family transcriptional regulator